MAPQDSFIEDDDETCPLCVEEFDLSDKNFRPCPCGYQICQFCYNNIKTNMNGLCPACRRVYDDQSIRWRVASPEEIAQFQANVKKNQKKKAELRQKEAQKREVETLNRKHLSGLRVVQKNLVYVVGLSPGIREEEILQTLRGDKYFGQYGKIIKIVVSKAKQGETTTNGQSLGVYVTFARKEDAAKCIAAVNGSQNGDRILRAQLGTTKYCSSYLRNETCNNKLCMFLHEPGDNDDSYSRQDLSSLNGVNSQRPIPALGSSSSATSSRQAAQLQAPIAAQLVAAATQSMIRDNSNQGSDSGDGSALPSSASWANRGLQQLSRRGSQATSGTTSSPAISQSLPATADLVASASLPTSDISPAESSHPRESDNNLGPKPSRPQRDPILQKLMLSINGPNSYTFETAIDEDAESSYPPLFDVNGGAKRRAMREQQEETRLHLEQESQSDPRSIPEPAEEEEPESGSLQLGGEPEDRETGRETTLQQGFQRRPSAQLPIQRGFNGGPFGTDNGQNLPRNMSNLSTINGHTLTDQQTQHYMQMKSQPQTFMAQFPPSMSSQAGQSSTLFQQQGHNRQSSRYSFANDSSSAASVKPSANPKLMAQQSSMMPSGNHFYGSSMPGPPPGLKSSGTPPVGGMFAQSHSFGGSMVSGKENNSDALRDMLRGRGAVSGNQSHDAGKRELMFPSFLNQYPSASSTPAPASGPLASLYGPQTGAFHDFGQKQKKKGKKHRHANTSSSGGGGLVDLADPSILQARMQHHQQSNAGVGQVFGGQSQDDEITSLDDEAATSVDALVADNVPDDFRTRSMDSFGFASRSSTPSVPPGFETNHGHPTPLVCEELVSKPPSKMIATSAEFTPSKARAATPLAQVSHPSSPLQTFSRIKQDVTTTQAKQEVKSLAASSGLSNTIATQSSQTAIQADEYPTLNAANAKPAASPSLAKVVKVQGPPTKKISLGPSSSASTSSVSKAITKLSTPGILNISAKTTAKASIVKTPELMTKPVIESSEFPPLKAAPAPSILPHKTPKTLRIAQLPKAEVQATSTAIPSSKLPPIVNTQRQTSLATTSRFDRPGTPTSDFVSENASVTSTSMSRANSPPPSRIGSAPVREVTKSMNRKSRQKTKEAATAAIIQLEPDATDVAPILGRKKKQKKEFSVGATTTSTPSASRAPSPSPVERNIGNSKFKGVANEAPQVIETQAVIVPEPEVSKQTSKTADVKGKSRAKHQQAPSPIQTLTATEVEDEPFEKPVPTPASVLQSLLDTELVASIDTLSFLKNLNSNFKSADLQIDTQNIGPKLTITPEDRAVLLDGHPVHKVAEGPNRIMLTPNGDCVRNLTASEERRYLALQSRIAEDAGPTAFMSSRYQTNNGFTLVGGRAVPNGPPSFFPVIAGTAAIDPVSKIQRDEALSYINQYVLPSLATNSQLEKALNANALDTDMLRSNDAGNWAAWGNDVNSSHPDPSEVSYGGAPNGEGMLGLENMTAHLAIGGNMDHRQPLGNVIMLGSVECETALQLAKKEVDSLEKKFNALLKKNRKLLLPSQH